jgi:hypothetical protein
MGNFVARIDEPGEPNRPHISLPRKSRAQGTPGLEIVRGHARQMFRPITGPVFMVGTAADCDLVLADPEFPETFLYLYLKDEQVTVRRLGVGPDLYVDEMTTDSAVLGIGSLLEFGPYAFRLASQTSHGEGPDRGPGGRDDDNDDEPFLTADFSAWEVDESAAVDKVRALLAEIRAALAHDRADQGLRLFSGDRAQTLGSKPLRRQSA